MALALLARQPLAGEGARQQIVEFGYVVLD